jgi:hypothetical protein
VASKRRVRRRSCTSKRRLTQTEAVGLANALRQKRPGFEWKVYRCGFCGGFHVGQTTRAQKRRDGTGPFER